MIDIHFDDEKKRCTAICSGEVTAAELAEYLTAWQADKYRDYDELFLGRSAFSLISFSDLLTHSEQASKINTFLSPDARTAIVAIDEFTQELGDFFAATQTLQGTREVRTFLSETEAIAWLDRKLPS
ncbi:MAG: hypothetical protein KDI36_17725 [Pseudomonadales bacterium]|nr:hypothetical protein [Pseudomonadales bacterium]